MPVSWGLRTGRPPTRASACPSGIAVDPAGQAVVADLNSHALRRVSKAGEVSTLADNCESGQGATAHFYLPAGVVLAANGEFIVADSGNHALRVVTPGGAVCTLVGNRKRGFADGQGAAARFYLTTSPVRASERSERARLYVWAKYGSSVCCVWARTSKGQGPLPSTGCPSERSHTFSFTGIDSLQRRQKAKSLLLSLSFQILAPLPLISNRFVHLMGKANSSFLHGTSNSLDRMVGWFWRGAALHTTPSQLKNSQVKQQNNTESAQNASRISRGLNPRRNRHEQDE